MADLDPGTVEELTALEEGMWLPATRGDRAWMDARLAAGFTEFGRSGRRYTREDVLSIEVDGIGAALPLPELDLRAVASDVVLVTYVSEVRGERANRASLWRRTPAGWLLEFHQGTPC